MKSLQSYGTAVTLVVIALVIILPLLAYLQYTWLTRISEQESVRMRENLETSAYHCSMNFSREITGLMKSLGGTMNGSDDGVVEIARQRITAWRAMSSYPSLVSQNISVVRSPSPEQAARIMFTEESALFLLKDLSAIAIPITNQPQRAVMVFLDREYISSVILPEFIQTDFPSGMRSEYDFIILNESDSLLYNSQKTVLHEAFQNYDLRIPFLIFPPAPLNELPPNWPDRVPSHAVTGHPPEPPERNPRNFDRKPDLLPARESLTSRAPERRFREQGLFEMRLINKEGSLETAVRNNRLRNTAMSFGILFLLGVSVLFLLLATQRARRLAQQQMEFVASISHELRTPLAVLKSAGENLADGVIQRKERTREYGELIKSEVLRLSEMVEKSLAYAGIQSGKQRYELHPLNLAPIIDESIRNAKKLLRSNNFTAHVTIDQNLPQIMGDATALQSALENLIINGIKYSAEKEWIRIEVIHLVESHVSRVKINVEDRGIGIAAAELSNIFKPFYRGRNAVDSQIQGSGLGLSITKHIIESHGGTISVKSSPHEGSVFTLLLPSIASEKERT